MKLGQFDEFFEIQQQNGNLSDGTIRKYRAGVVSFSEWRGTDGSPTVAEIQDFLLALASEDDLAGATLNVYKCALQKYLTSVEARAADAVQLREWFSDNFRVSSGTRPDFLSTDEADAVRDAAREDPRTSAMVTLLLRTGMRVGELVALDESDVVLETDEDGNGFVEITRTKRRDDPVTDRRKLYPDDIDQIERYLDAKSEYGPPGAEQSNALFVTGRPSETGDDPYRITESYVRSICTELGDDTDHPEVTGERVHPHLFRHTVGSWLGSEGYNADEIGDYLGKASSAEEYVHLDQSKHDDIAEVLVNVEDDGLDESSDAVA